VIGIFGAGKMGEALISGLLRSGYAPSGVVAVVRRPERADELRTAYGVAVLPAAEAAKSADTLIITVKPQDMLPMLDEIAPHVPAGKLDISVAAGITTGLIEIGAAQAVLTGRGTTGFEYQMLYGVRPAEQRRLASTSATVRVYVPYGRDWYRYLVRRLAERPANLAFFLRSLASRG